MPLSNLSATAPEWRRLARCLAPARRAVSSVITDSWTSDGPGQYVFVMGNSVLVVSTVEDANDFLRPHFGEADTIKVVVPVRFSAKVSGSGTA
jgi:hypothetical protein